MSATKLQILIVDDQQDIVEGLVDRLKFKGFNVEAAQDGEQALEIARTKQPELLILDIMMPNIKGDEVCKLLKKDLKTQHILILMLTVRGDLRSAMFNSGADGYITKPFKPTELEKRIEFLLKLNNLSRNKLEPPALPIYPIENLSEIEIDVETDGYIIGFKDNLNLDPLVIEQLTTTIDDFGFKPKTEILPKTNIRWMKGTKEEAENFKARIPELIIAPNTIHHAINSKNSYHMLSYPPLENFHKIDFLPPHRNIKITIYDKASSKPIEKAKVWLITEKEEKQLFGYDAISNFQGECNFVVSDIYKNFDLIILPFTTYWSKRYENVLITSHYTVNLDPVMPNQSSYDWGHKFAGMYCGLAKVGTGIRIGIIDSGISSHPDLRPTQCHNFVSGSNADDIDGHGSHVAGIIAGLGNVGVKGYIPEAEIYSYKIFEGNKRADDVTMLKALLKAIEDNCHIINISSGSPAPNAIMLQQIEKAYEEGVICIASSGNRNGKVQYPAAYKKVLAVSAFGKLGTYPDDSIHMYAESEPLSHIDNTCFIASFSSRGAQINFCAPGVAIVSTHLDQGYAVLDGTSMACPHITGIVGLILAANHSILTSPPKERTKQLLDEAHKYTYCLGFNPTLQGEGCLKIKDKLLNNILSSNLSPSNSDPP